MTDLLVECDQCHGWINEKVDNYALVQDPHGYYHHLHPRPCVDQYCASTGSVVAAEHKVRAYTHCPRLD